MRKASLILVVLSLSACASPTPQVDARFGNAVNAAKAQQVIDPQAASKAPDPVGVGAAAAVESMQRYQDSFKAPPPSFIIISPPAGGGTR
jgi:hypothetical protein